MTSITATRLATKTRTWLLIAGLTGLLVAIGGAIGILVSSIAAMVAGAVSAIANLLQFSLLFGGSDDEDSPLGLLGTLATIILAPIAAMLLQLGVSRQREFLADATGAQILGVAAPLADALESLERGTKLLPMRVNPATASLYAANPLPRAGVSALFMTHPHTAERVRRLRALDAPVAPRVAVA